MISLEELKEHKRLLNLNLGQTEKNYIHVAVLFAISKLFPEKFIFKGGTCLMICYNLDRFSEDLDFDIKEEIDLEKTLDEIKRFLYKYDILIDYKITPNKRYEDCFIYFYGMLYKNTNNTRCKIKLDFSKRKDFIKKEEMIKVNHVYNEFPLFYINTLNVNEMFSEKIRAIIQRNKARDLYDLHYLINRKVVFDIDLVNKKLSVYNQKFSIKEFSDAVKNKENIWDKELSHLISNYPTFKEVYKEVIAYITNKKD